VAGREEFTVHFVAAKRHVAAMPVRFTPENDPALRTVFEVYAPYALGTSEFNVHEKH
jgi:hypothetical protein